MKKQDAASEIEYSKKPLPNESVRSHVAMDFKNNVGRIVEDPQEAKAIAEADSSSTRRSWRFHNTKPHPGLQAAIAKLENDIHLSQPWYHKDMSRDQAANVLNGYGNNDGYGFIIIFFYIFIFLQTINLNNKNFRVFLIRESRSKISSYVLSFKCSGKIIHAPIIVVSNYITFININCHDN